MFFKIFQYSQENTCVGVSKIADLQACNCKIFKNTYFEKHLRMAAFEIARLPVLQII